MKIAFRESFCKDLEKIHDQSLLRRIKKMILLVEKADNLHSISQLRKLKTEGSHWAIRIGEYRIGLFYGQKTLIFVRFLHRSEIYRYFP